MWCIKAFFSVLSGVKLFSLISVVSHDCVCVSVSCDGQWVLEALGKISIDSIKLVFSFANQNLSRHIVGSASQKPFAMHDLSTRLENQLVHLNFDIGEVNRVSFFITSEIVILSDLQSRNHRNDILIYLLGDRREPFLTNKASSGHRPQSSSDHGHRPFRDWAPDYFKQFSKLISAATTKLKPFRLITTEIAWTRLSKVDLTSAVRISKCNRWGLFSKSYPSKLLVSFIFLDLINGPRASVWLLLFSYQFSLLPRGSLSL